MQGRGGIRQKRLAIFILGQQLMILDKGQEALYDRQIRVWGAQSQKL